MKTVVISQPMFFPWPGLLEQLRLADIFVHYDDVQFSKGSFTNRVQVKTARGAKWLSVPLVDLHLGQSINEVLIDPREDWRQQHVGLLAQAYAGAPYVQDMLDLVRQVYAKAHASLADLAMESERVVAAYLGLEGVGERARSSDLGIAGRSDDRVLAVVKHFGGDRYVTGHGARHYLDHAMFEAAGVDVFYMDYEKRSYRQLHGNFTPFVSTLDLIANCGARGREALVSSAIPWRDFLARSTPLAAGV